MIRPILEISKDDINKYCSENNIEYVTDSTNTDTDYTRNRIRSRVIPELKAICPSAESAAARLSATLREDSLCLESMASWFLDETRNGFFIETEKLCGSPYAISSRALMSLYSEISDGHSLEYTHIKAIFELAKKAVPHSSLNLPNGVRAVVENGSLGFTKAPPIQRNLEREAFSVKLCEGENRISQINSEIIIGYTQKGKNIYKKSMNLSIDFDKIVGNLYARERRTGEKIRMNSMGKSLKKLMCDKKVPEELRHRIPVICDDRGIVAVPYIGVSDLCAVTAQTQNIMLIEFKPL